MRFASIFLALAAFGSVNPSLASPVQWSGNGHWYEAVVRPNGIVWDAAQAEAVSRGGYLATLTSSAENAFVFGLVNSIPAIWWQTDNDTGQRGPWLGGYQTAGVYDPESSWNWVSGEPWVYTNWFGPIEPNGYGTLDWLQFTGDEVTPRTAGWNDCEPEYAPMMLGFVVEFNTPEPGLLGLGVVGLAVLLAGRTRRERRGRAHGRIAMNAGA